MANDEHADNGQTDLGVDDVPGGGRPPVPAVSQSQDTEHKARVHFAHLSLHN